MELAMFPLGNTVLPGELLPLRVFEPRYRQLMVDAIEGKLPADGQGRPQFGVTLIARGSDVGGGDTRTSTATLVTLRSISPGEAALNVVAGGVRRLAVMEWLVDDPYPRADVEPWPETLPDDDDQAAAVAAARSALIERVPVLRELASDVDPRQRRRLSAPPRIGADPTMASYQLAAAVPLGPADRQRILEAPTVAVRYETLTAAFDDLEAMLRFRIG